jgi:hypothetical protein
MKRYGFAEFAHHQNRENQVPSAPPPPPLLSVFFYKIHKAIVQPCANQYCTLGDTANFVTESSSYCRHSICPPADEGHNVYLTFPIAVVPRGDGQFEGFCLLCFLSQIKFLLELTVSLVWYNWSSFPGNFIGPKGLSNASIRVPESAASVATGETVALFALARSTRQRGPVASAETRLSGWSPGKNSCLITKISTRWINGRGIEAAKETASPPRQARVEKKEAINVSAELPGKAQKSLPQGLLRLFVPWRWSGKILSRQSSRSSHQLEFSGYLRQL